LFESRVPPRLLLRRNCHPTIEQRISGQQTCIDGGFHARLTWNSEGVKAIVIDKVLHLVETSLARVYYTRGLACTIDGAAKVETSDLFLC
jgi:hypothetical protein